MQQRADSGDSVRAVLEAKGVPVRPETFLAAIEGGDLETLRALLQAGISVDMARAVAGNDPLFNAVRGPEPEVVSILVGNGADVAARNDAGLTPLVAAVVARRSDIVAALLAGGAGANETAPDGRTVLMLAAADDQPGLVRALIAGGATVATAGPDGADALVHAIRSRAVAAVSALLQAGADLAAPRGDAGTPEEVAKRLRFPDVLKALRETPARNESPPHADRRRAAASHTEASEGGLRADTGARPWAVAAALALGVALAVATAGLVWQRSTSALLADPRLQAEEVARRSLAAAVDDIEAYRAEYGKLPDGGAAAAFVDWVGIEYTVDGAGSSYVVTVRVAGVTATHQGGPTVDGGR